MRSLSLTSACCDNVVSVAASQSLSEVAGKLKEERARFVIVEETGEFLGALELTGSVLAWPERTFREIMRRSSLPTVFEKASLEEVGQLLQAEQAKAVAVVDDENRCQGIISRQSLMTALLETVTHQRTGLSRLQRELAEERQQVQAAYHSHKQLLETIRTVQGQLGTLSDPKRFYDHLLAHILELTESEYGFIGDVLFDETGRQYMKIRGLTDIAWDEQTRAFYDENAEKGFDFFNLDNLFGAVVTSGEVVLSNAPSQDERARGLPSGHPPLRAFLGLPIDAGGKLTGIIGLANRAGGYDLSLAEYLEPLVRTYGTLIEAYWKSRNTKQAETRFRGLLEASPDALVIINEQGRIELINSQTETMFGYTAGELLGQPVEMLLPEPLRQKHELLRNEYLRNPRMRMMGENQHLYGQRKDGSRFPIDLSLSPVQTDDGLVVMGVVRDLTRQREMEQNLSRQALQAKLIHEATMLAAETENFEQALQGCVDIICLLTEWPVGHVYLPAEDGRDVIVPTSIWHLRDESRYAAFRRMTERTEFRCGEGLPGRIWECGHPLWISNIQSQGNLHRFAGEGETPLHGAFGFPVRVGGQTVAVLEFFSEEELQPDESLLETVATVGEQVGRVLERKMAEEAFLKQAHQLREAQKLEAVGTLAGGVAHEFNNLLQAIGGYGQFALESLAAEDPARDDLNEILKTVDRASRLTKQLLGFSRRQILDQAAYHPNTLVENLTGMLRPLIGERIKVSTRLDPQVRKIFGDAGQLEQVLLNLCLNARDAMPEGGELILSTRLTGEGEALPDALADRSNRQWVVLSVRDDGTGMPAEIVEHIFEPFFTTKEAGVGTGLGLSMAFGLIQQHGGTIEVETKAGEGSIFHIYLPVHEEEAECEGTEGDLPEEKPPTVILVAEDAHLVRDVTVRMLRKAGYEVHAACDGAEAVQLFEQHADEIALAVLDIVMPHKDGHEVNRHIQSLRPGLPVLFVTAYDPASSRAQEWVEEGEHIRLLEKPYVQDVFLQNVQQLIAQFSPRVSTAETPSADQKQPILC